MNGTWDDEAAMVGELRARGYLVERVVAPHGAPEQERYRPYVNPWSVFSPWADDPLLRGLLAALKRGGAKTLIGLDRLYILKTLAGQCRGLGGEFWEAGVYQGGSALLLRMILEDCTPPVPMLRLFDTFRGMPETRRGLDLHREGDFGDSSLDKVRALVGDAAFVDYRRGLVPETFAPLGASRIAFAHVDLDIHDAVRGACEFVYPRLLPGGVMVFDDYGYHTCPGARVAVDRFFAGKRETPLCLPTGQAIVFKLP